jgi:hypothetical protein
VSDLKWVVALETEVNQWPGVVCVGIVSVLCVLGASIICACVI